MYHAYIGFIMWITRTHIFLLLLTETSYYKKIDQQMVDHRKSVFARSSVQKQSHCAQNGLFMSFFFSRKLDLLKKFSRFENQYFIILTFFMKKLTLHNQKVDLAKICIWAKLIVNKCWVQKVVEILKVVVLNLYWRGY